MKVVSKKYLVKKEQVGYAKSERDIMTKIDHPFLIKMRWCFQTKDKIFLVMDYKEGGELFYHLRNEGMMLESTAVFYIAEVVRAEALTRTLNPNP
jgi:serine/threonine protein kinase